MAHPASIAPINGSCPFLAAPKEIRERIYKFAIGISYLEAMLTKTTYGSPAKDHYRIWYRKGDFIGSMHDQSPANIVNLDLVSKQVRDESHLLFFSENVFHARYSTFNAWIMCLSDSERNSIRSVFITDALTRGAPSTSTTMRFLPFKLYTCTGLTTVICHVQCTPEVRAETRGLVDYLNRKKEDEQADAVILQQEGPRQQQKLLMAAESNLVLQSYV